MNRNDKSLKLAELMGWKITDGEGQYKGSPCVKVWPDRLWSRLLCPYEESEDGYTQAHAILLKFPEVMVRVFPHVPVFDRNNNFKELQINEDFEPTQENLLDEILRMNGVDHEN